MKPITRLVALLALVGMCSGCALTARRASVAELKYNAARYQNKTVTIDGVVTSSWGVPLVPFKLYKVDDGTGEMTVLSQDGRTPTKGARVRVKGRVNEFATFGGQSVGLHLEQNDLEFKSDESAVIWTATAVMSSFGGEPPRSVRRRRRSRRRRARPAVSRSRTTTSMSRADVNSCPSVVHRFGHAVRAEHEHVARMQRKRDLVVRRPRNDPSGTPGSSIWRTSLRRTRIGYGSAELASVTMRRFMSKTA